MSICFKTVSDGKQGEPSTVLQLTAAKHLCFKLWLELGHEIKNTDGNVDLNFPNVWCALWVHCKDKFGTRF